MELNVGVRKQKKLHQSYVLYLLYYYYDGMYKNKIVLLYILYLNDFKASCLRRAREWKSPTDVVFVTIQYIHMYRTTLHGVFVYFCIVNTMKKVYYYYCYYRRAIHIVRLRKQKQKIPASFPVARTITKNRNNAVCRPRTPHLHLSVYPLMCVRASPRRYSPVVVTARCVHRRICLGMWWKIVCCCYELFHFVFSF